MLGWTPHLIFGERMAAKQYNEYGEGDEYEGPFELDEENIGALANVRGVYLLADIASDDEDIIIVTYVGRGNIPSRLMAHADAERAAFFFVKVIASESAAFREECRLFHKYGKRRHLDNQIHPALPAGSTSTKKCSERGCNGEPD